ncbi:NAD-dependent epimerase/dehydratase family protein [Gordonia sp. CPCC 205515]|uniref:NAD-dependent epimerase/dehydratase family protein n=1 Tax=Gordonia sp. CPCC 205515 TaxID=3140791 RepID=UPI003AF34D4F
MTRVLLTGAAGFIGSQIRELLARRGVDVVAVDALIPQAHSSGAAPRGIRRIDVRDLDALTDMLAGIDVVCHQAAMVGMGTDMSDAPLYAGHNDLGTATLLAAMDRTGCRRLVLASSMVVYGHGALRGPGGELVTYPPARRRADLDAGDYEPHLPDGRPTSWALTTEDAPLTPTSIYAASKVAQENYVRAWSITTGGSAIALRYHNVYGPGMPRDTPYAGVASIFRSRLERGLAPMVFEDGGQMRDFVHVSDVAAANAAAIELLLARPSQEFTPLNICSGQPVSVGEVATILSGHRGGPVPVITGEVRPADVRHIVADPARARATLGFAACISPEEGLREFADARLRPSVGVG